MLGVRRRDHREHRVRVASRARARARFAFVPRDKESIDMAPQERSLSSAPATSAASSPRLVRAQASSATSCSSTSPRRRASPRARRSTSSRTAPSSATTRSITGTLELGRRRRRRRRHHHRGHAAQARACRATIWSAINLPIIRNVAENAQEALPRTRSSSSISNPLDAMVYEFKRSPGFARKKVVGMAGVLDSGALPALPRARGRRRGQGRARDGARRPRRRHGAGAQRLHRSTASRCAQLIAADKLDGDRRPHAQAAAARSSS